MFPNDANTTAVMKTRTAFVSSAPLGLSAPRSALFGRPATTPTRAPHVQVTHSRPRRSRVSMGLFGLGLGELAVIAGVGILFFGPSKIADMGKDLGGIAGGVKKASAEFKEAMEVSLEQADKEIEQRRIEKENQATPTSARSTTTTATTSNATSSEPDVSPSDAASQTTKE